VLPAFFISRKIGIIIVMKIGIFDSGIGGLFILKAIRRALPQYDYLYLGDTKRVPYGNRSEQVIYEFTRAAVAHLFQHGCALVILACNTASAKALRRIQREYLSKHYPKRRVLGVIIPTVEAVAENRKIKRVGVLATSGTVSSGAYLREFKKANPKQKIFQQAAPLLVPLVESGELQFSRPILRNYLQPLLRRRVEAVVLGCTHYPILKNRIQTLVGKKIKVVSQDALVARRLVDYLQRHPEIEKLLAKKSQLRLIVTDVTPAMQGLTRKWFGSRVALRLVKL
jgi:glutamate racemase